MYKTYLVNLSQRQKESLAKAFKNKSELTLRLKHNQLTGNFPLMLTKRQINNINKSKTKKTGIDINISKSQMRKQSQNGGFIGALAGLLGKTVLPTVAKFAPKILAPLGVGALSGLASTGVSKILGNGIIEIPSDKKSAVINTGQLTPSQKRQLQQGGRIKLTKKQQEGGFLPLLASLGIPLVGSLISGLTGKGLQVKRPRGRGLQVDSQVQKYRRIPIVKKK